jgi:hypothetical protein
MHVIGAVRGGHKKTKAASTHHACAKVCDLRRTYGIATKSHGQRSPLVLRDSESAAARICNRA